MMSKDAFSITVHAENVSVNAVIRESNNTVMMIDKGIQLRRPWRVNDIARDFKLWDAWEVPIDADNSATENFLSFYEVAFEAFNKMQTRTSASGFLFTLRNWIGRFVPLDRNVNTLPIPGFRETSVKDRLSAADLQESSTGKTIALNDTGLGFRLVYLFGDESLHELSNDTVHGLMHLGWIKKNDARYTATLAVYVKPRGTLGKLYLKMIEPFRHLIVYPALMKAIETEWLEYIGAKDSGAQ